MSTSLEESDFFGGAYFFLLTREEAFLLFGKMNQLSNQLDITIGNTAGKWVEAQASTLQAFLRLRYDHWEDKGEGERGIDVNVRWYSKNELAISIVFNTRHTVSDARIAELSGFLNSKPQQIFLPHQRVTPCVSESVRVHVPHPLACGLRFSNFGDCVVDLLCAGNAPLLLPSSTKIVSVSIDKGYVGEPDSQIGFTFVMTKIKMDGDDSTLRVVGESLQRFDSAECSVSAVSTKEWNFAKTKEDDGTDAMAEVSDYEYTGITLFLKEEDTENLKSCADSDENVDEDQLFHVDFSSLVFTLGLQHSANAQKN